MKNNESFLSKRIRDAIKRRGVASYHLAINVGVSPAMLSGFIFGKQELKLETLEKFSGVLGIEAVSTTEKAISPGPKGRKLAKKKKLDPFEEWLHWHQVALDCAKDSFENNFKSRCGDYLLSDVDKLCIYNNEPTGGIFLNLRDVELAEFRQRLKSEGIQELGFATYPSKGQEEAGCTYAMILDAGANRQRWAKDVWNDIRA
jgi:transcriptional regulator with XRE-family HTH domain